jgi:hypothetical protein
VITLGCYKAHASTSAARRGTLLVLAGILVVFALALLGLGMAGWVRSLGILRAVTPASQIAWHTALYLRATVAPPSRRRGRASP